MTEERELSDVEKLVIAQAFYKAVGKLVDTKDGANLRAAVDAYFKDVFEETGGKSFDVHLFGNKVGTYSLTIGKPTPQKTTHEFEVEDRDAFIEWAHANGCMTVDWDVVRQKFSDTGEVPDGCRVVDVITPANPGGNVTRSTFKVDVDSMLDALGGYLPEASRQLLEGDIR